MSGLARLRQLVDEARRAFRARPNALWSDRTYLAPKDAELLAQIAEPDVVFVWHPNWEQNKRHSNIGRLVGRFVAETGEEYGWAIPPGSARPLTFTMASLTIIPSGEHV